MKSICNVFKSIDKTNGNFLLFSQYTNDISRSVVDSTYKVRPSKFVCLNLDSAAQTTANNLTQIGGSSPFTPAGTETPYMYYLPGFFQNNFENGVCRLRNNNYTVNSFQFAVAFVEKLVQLTQNTGAVNLQSYIKYIGNIDVESWDGGFADIVLSINSGAKEKTVTLNPNSSIPTSVTNFSNNFCGAYTYTNDETSGGWSISGWKEATQNPPISKLVNQTGTIGSGRTIENNTCMFNETDSWIEKMFTITDATSSSFTFNTILVLYNVETTNDGTTVVYKDIPMGIYFAGQGIETGISNAVTIYSYSDTAYGAGSGWSLRIGTKFSPLPYGGLQVEEVALESQAITHSINALMSAAAETIKTINEFADQSIYSSQTIKEDLAQFKNARVNVPYIKSVNGTPYWFINGRNTEQRVYPN